MLFRMKPITLAIALVLTHSAYAQEQKNHFSIPTQSLDSALDLFAKQSGLQMLYAQHISEGKYSHELNGDYTNEQALKLLLLESGLANSISEGTVTIKPAQTNNFSDKIDLKPMTVVGKNSVNQQEAYKVSDAFTATKSDAPIMETPYSVSVVPQQVLQDQKMIRVEDAVKNVAGVKQSWTNGGNSDVFMLRGFDNLNLYRDGFLMPSALGGGTTKRQTANLERVEALKGPASILYGRNEPGGVINLVTKRPQAASAHSIEQQFGSYDFYRTLVDSTGAITPDDKLLYRVNLSYENANSFRDFVKTDTFFIAPSFTWNISDQTQANLDIEYQRFDNTSDSGVPPLGKRPAPIPINTQMGEPLNNKNIGDRTYIGANWSHNFNDKWKLNHRFGAEFLDQASDFTFFFGQPTSDGNFVNNDADWNGNRGFNNANSSQMQNYYTTLNLSGKFDTAMLEHSMLWGFDYFVIDNKDSTACCSAYPEGENFNIFHPTYLTQAPNLNYAVTADFTQNWYGLYFQDQIKFPFNIYGNVGLRYDNAESNNNLNGVASVDDAVSPRGGLLWKPLKWLSVYGSYTENFGVSNSMWNAPKQSILPPKTAQQWEVGTKTEFLEGRLAASLAYFDLTQQNTPVYFTNNITRTIGEQESRGYELEVSGEVLPGWRIINAYTHLSYANINNDTSDGGRGNTDHRMYNTPRNFGSVWNTYDFQTAALHGLKVGAGVIASSQSQGTDANNFQLPGYATLNLMTSYGMKVAGHKMTLQLNANNLLDKTYYQGTNTGSMIGVGTPRFFMGSVKVEF